MGYIDNKTNEVIIDAVLTKEGRLKLSKNGKLDIKYFALSDDEVDYALYNTTNPNGSDDYDIAIRKMPILEALPGDFMTMRYKLYTSDSDTTTSTILAINLSIAPELQDLTALIGPRYSVTPSLSGYSDASNQIYYVVTISGGTQVNSIQLIGQNDPSLETNELLALQQQLAAEGGESNPQKTQLQAAGHFFYVRIFNKISPSATLKVRAEARGGNVSVTPAESTITLDIPELPPADPNTLRA